jgi:hypothetical protein
MIVIGTSNPAKVRQCWLALAEVVEDGWDAEENAARKALAYSRATGLPVLSLDYALVFEGLPAEHQPGMNVRRMRGLGERPTDEQLVDYYSALLASHGGRIRGRWEAGAAVAAPDGRVERTTILVHRMFVSQPSAVRVDGHQLASLQLADETTYVSELNERDEEQHWQRVLGAPLRELVSAALRPRRRVAAS